MTRSVKVFHGFAEAERADEEFYSSLSPRQRVDILLDLIASYRESLGEAAERFERVEFDEAWADQVRSEIDGIPTSFLGRESLIKNKLATGRDQDLVDARRLEAIAAAGRPATGGSRTGSPRG